ncbi:hypothetical protein CJ739_610 [Mariniflexile rhizosphaerae]|nr:hypothetical protein CJ739_610 [Mariniflexile sp. TRM1-10]
MNFNQIPSTEKWNELWSAFLTIQPRKEIFEQSAAEHIQFHFDLNTDWSPMRNFFFERLSAAEFHWFFVQGVDCMFNEFYVPAVSSFLNGIEASLRITIAQIQNSENDFVELTPYKVLSNNLIMDARNLGLPIEALAFPNETDFIEKLESVKPNIKMVEIVRHRNNICHGNILEFINTELGKGNSFFTPVSLRILCFELLSISGKWAEQLGEFRRKNKISHCDK